MKIILIQEGKYRWMDAWIDLVEFLIGFHWRVYRQLTLLINLRDLMIDILTANSLRRPTYGNQSKTIFIGVLNSNTLRAISTRSRWSSLWDLLYERSTIIDHLKSRYNEKLLFWVCIATENVNTVSKRYLDGYTTIVERQCNNSKIQSNNMRWARALVKINGAVRAYRQSLNTLPILYMYVLNYNKIKKKISENKIKLLSPSSNHRFAEKKCRGIEINKT